MATKSLYSDEIGPDDVVGPDPRAYQPSPVPGMTKLEYDEIAAQIHWMALYSLTEKLRAAQQAIVDEHVFFGGRRRDEG